VGGRSTPLGAVLRLPERTEARVRLSPGDRIVLYTDGLIERRDRSLDAGLALLAETAAKGSRLPLDDAPRAYAMFQAKSDGCFKVVLKP